MPEPCDDQSGRVVPVVNRGRCEGKEDCVEVCPYDVFVVRRLTPEERQGLGVRARLMLFAHRGRQAIVAAGENCHACGLCVNACPENALKLVPATRLA
jgi:NAD-dependent dihydropyrimidine dehydrogenase PreA subunit